MNTTAITEDVQWLNWCHEENNKHTHVSQYILKGDKNILIDAGEGDRDEMLSTIDEETNGEGIDVLLLTHSILPHTANVGSIQERYGDIEVISSSPISALVGLENAEAKKLNSTASFGNRDITFLDPLLTDAVVSNWIYDRKSKILFTAEGFGHYHRPGQCDQTSEDLGGISHKNVHNFHEDKLPYLEYVDPEKLHAGIESLFTEFDIECIAPMHGNPVSKDDIDDYIDIIISSCKELKTRS